MLGNNRLTGPIQLVWHQSIPISSAVEAVVFVQQTLHPHKKALWVLPKTGDGYEYPNYSFPDWQKIFAENDYSAGRAWGSIRKAFEKSNPGFQKGSNSVDRRVLISGLSSFLKNKKVLNVKIIFPSPYAF